MKRIRTHAAPAAFAILVAPTALAGFMGAFAEPFVGEGWNANGYENLHTFRLYAHFDMKGDDGVLAVIADGIEMRAASYNGWFYNDHNVGGLTAPFDATGGGYWANQWDTYVTINATQAVGDATTLSPGFGDETNDLCTNWSTIDAGWFVSPSDPQSMADADGRVLLGQFTTLNDAVAFQATLLLRDGSEVFVGEVVEFGACPGDVNGNFARDFADILAIIQAWGACNGCPEDSNCSGSVDFEDLLTVLGNWGECVQ